jgi:tetratricopeptide (TPR) repeat protein
LLDAGLRLDGSAADWSDFARIFPETVLPLLSDETRRVVGDQWVSLDNGTEERPWYGSHFHYAFVIPAARGHKQIRQILDFARRLEDSDPDSNTPQYLRAREWFHLGLRRLSQGLIEKATEAFRKSEEENELNFLAHLLLGKLQLYGVDEYVNVIDLPEAERHLRAAARFARLHPAGPLVCNEFAAEACFHAAVACYARSSTEAMAHQGNGHAAFLETGLAHAGRAIDLNPHMAEAHYHQAKLRARLGEGGPAIEALRQAVFADPNYCLKADVDPDFVSLRNRLLQFYEELRQETEREFATVVASLAQFRSRNGLVVLSSRAVETVQELKRVPQLPSPQERKPYLPLAAEFRRVRALHGSLRSLLREGCIGEPVAARSTAERRIQEAETAVQLAQRLALAGEASLFKLRELRDSVDSSGAYYSDIAAEAEQLRDTNFNSAQDYFRHLQSTATGRLEKTRDEITYAQLAENDCKGVFGGAGIIGTLTGAGLGGALGFFLGHFYLFVGVGIAVALGWFTWNEGIIGRFRWRHVVRHKAAEFQALEEEVQGFSALLSKCSARTLTAADLPE